MIDDDDEEVFEDEWLEGGSPSDADVIKHSSTVALQLRLCLLLLCAIPAIIAVIALAWRRYGDIICSAKGSRHDTATAAGPGPGCGTTNAASDAQSVASKQSRRSADTTFGAVREGAANKKVL